MPVKLIVMILITGNYETRSAGMPESILRFPITWKKNFKQYCIFWSND